MYYHAFVPVDCSENARRSVRDLTCYLEKLPSCRVTLVAATTPAPTPEIRQKKREHALIALNAIQSLLHARGVHTNTRIVEGANPAAALAAETEDDAQQYDLVLLTTYQTRPEIDDFPCAGSLADQLCGRVHIPVLILPVHPNEPIALTGDIATGAIK